MHVVIVGGGAMGSLFAGQLTAGGLDVTLIDRNADHVTTIEREGLYLLEDGAERQIDVTATTDPAGVDSATVLLVLVKSYDTAAAIRDATPVIEPETDVVTLQNGLGNAETIAEYVPDQRVLAGITTAGATRVAPGRVRVAGTGETVLGRYFVPNDDHVDRLAGRFADAGIPTTATRDVRRILWEKVLVNVAINAPTALSRVRNGALVEREPGAELLQNAVTEAEQVARAAGHDVRPDVVEYASHVAAQTATNVSSMRADLDAGSRTEVESLYGAVIDRADRDGIEVPVLRTLANLVRLADGCERRTEER